MKLCSHQILYKNVYSRLVHNSCKLETAHESFNVQLITQTEMHPGRGIILNKEKECTIEVSMSDPCWDGNVLYIDWINIQVVIL